MQSLFLSFVVGFLVNFVSAIAVDAFLHRGDKK